MESVAFLALDLINRTMGLERVTPDALVKTMVAYTKPQVRVTKPVIREYKHYSR